MAGDTGRVRFASISRCRNRCCSATHRERQQLPATNEDQAQRLPKKNRADLVWKVGMVLSGVVAPLLLAFVVWNNGITSEPTEHQLPPSTSAHR